MFSPTIYSFRMGRAGLLFTFAVVLLFTGIRSGYGESAKHEQRPAPNFSGPKFAKLSDREQGLLTEYYRHYLKHVDYYGNVRLHATEQYWGMPFSDDGPFPASPNWSPSEKQEYEYVYQSRDSGYFRLDTLNEGKCIQSRLITPLYTSLLKVDPNTNKWFRVYRRDRTESLSGIESEFFLSSYGPMSSVLFQDTKGFTVERVAETDEAGRSIITVTTCLVDKRGTTTWSIHLDKTRSWAIVGIETNRSPDEFSRIYTTERGCHYDDNGAGPPKIKYIAFKEFVESPQKSKRRLTRKWECAVNEIREESIPLGEFDPSSRLEPEIGLVSQTTTVWGTGTAPGIAHAARHAHTCPVHAQGTNVFRFDVPYCHRFKRLVLGSLRAT